ncbi:MAG TPA: type II toxin-antitoxin system RelE/ParE family toxin [Phenylobacterium sp.]|nr:type II toxin-antitoxin system RelE/ParE family toxin [Phenylobacterium sp.]
MIRRAVVFSPEARNDLKALYEDIASTASNELAMAYLGRVNAYLASFDLASERGAIRDHIKPGLRTIGFERRITIAFTVGPQEVTIHRVFYGGQDWPRLLT